MTTALRLPAGPTERVLELARRRGVMLPAQFYASENKLVRQTAFTASGLAGIEQIQALKNQLDAHFARGGSLDEWKRLAREGKVGLGLPLHRQSTIVRTNLQMLNSRGRGEWAKANAASHPFLMYSAVNDSRTRPAHRALHGVIRPVDDPFWRTHRCPNGFNCRCVLISLTRREAERRGITTELPNAQPDPGFDFDPWEDPAGGVKRAVQRVRSTTPAAGKALDAIEREAARRAPLPRPTTPDEAIERGRTVLGEIEREIGTVAAGNTQGAEVLRQRIRRKIRETHGEPETLRVTSTTASPAALRLFREAAAELPAPWVRASNAAAGDLRVARTVGRAFHAGNPTSVVQAFKHRGRRMTLEPGDSFATAGSVRSALHEYAHRLQMQMPELDALFQAYHKRRTVGEYPRPLSELVPGRGYSRNERARRDQYVEAYFGREYVGFANGPSGALEVMTMALEYSLGSAETLLLLYAADREMLEFVLGVLLAWEP